MALEFIRQGKLHRLRLRVSPKASRDKIASEHAGGLKISVTAAPERGKANQAVIELLAKKLGVPKKAITIVSGETSQDKVVEIEFDGDLERRLLD